MAFLEIQNICKDFTVGSTKLTVLDNINISFEKGEIVALCGPSGAGKSTLMNIIGGLDKPTSGDIIYNDENIISKSDTELDTYRGREVGFVFQNSYLLDDFTALENVMMPYQLSFNDDSKTAKEYALKLLEDFQLLDRKDHYPKELSGGEQQRIAVARAIINSPNIILADEPTGNLDRTNSNYLIELLQTLSSEKNITVIVVTHDELIASKLDRIIKLEKK